MARLQVPYVFTLEDARTSGLRKDEVYELVSMGVIHRIGRGVYEQDGVLPSETSIPIGVSLVRPEATLCLQSALAFHGLLDKTPERHHISVPRGMRFPAGFQTVDWHSFDRSTYDFGREMHSAEGDLQFAVYDPQRTLLDCFRLLHILGEETAMQALRAWSEERDNSLDELRTLAQHLPGVEWKLIPAISEIESI
ncbi:type IV toxin-antitoxin system AbiEi family antitoxin domain-containing protein [Corynebacterium freiburgense]|uniref:type IV toxin-antitoxin system AbiEi family antitoxin domain-containing protein n=1 Tax=Corynebacterium freiburgense TaxID=556548 RepID=UPI00041654FA|nr:hypothetical protein [Corynebacterium freiburgense]